MTSSTPVLRNIIESVEPNAIIRTTVSFTLNHNPLLAKEKCEIPLFMSGKRYNALLQLIHKNTNQPCLTFAFQKIVIWMDDTKQMEDSLCTHISIYQKNKKLEHVSNLSSHVTDLNLPIALQPFDVLQDEQVWLSRLGKFGKVYIQFQLHTDSHPMSVLVSDVYGFVKNHPNNTLSECASQMYKDDKMVLFSPVGDSYFYLAIANVKAHAFFTQAAVHSMYTQLSPSATEGLLPSYVIKSPPSPSRPPVYNPNHSTPPEDTLIRLHTRYDFAYDALSRTIRMDGQVDCFMMLSLWTKEVVKLANSVDELRNRKNWFVEYEANPNDIQWSTIHSIAFENLSRNPSVVMAFSSKRFLELTKVALSTCAQDIQIHFKKWSLEKEDQLMKRIDLHPEHQRVNIVWSLIDGSSTPIVCHLQCRKDIFDKISVEDKDWKIKDHIRYYVQNKSFIETKDNVSSVGVSTIHATDHERPPDPVPARSVSLYGPQSVSPQVSFFLLNLLTEEGKHIFYLNEDPSNAIFEHVQSILKHPDRSERQHSIDHFRNERELKNDRVDESDSRFLGLCSLPNEGKNVVDPHTHMRFSHILSMTLYSNDMLFFESQMNAFFEQRKYVHHEFVNIHQVLSSASSKPASSLMQESVLHPRTEQKAIRQMNNQWMDMYALFVSRFGPNYQVREDTHEQRSSFMVVDNQPWFYKWITFLTYMSIFVFNPRQAELATVIVHRCIDLKSNDEKESYVERLKENVKSVLDTNFRSTTSHNSNTTCDAALSRVHQICEDVMESKRNYYLTDVHGFIFFFSAANS